MLMNMDLKSTFLVFIINIVLIDSIKVSSYLSQTDKDRFKGIFQRAQPYKDLADCYYSLLGLDLLNIKLENAKKICEFVKTKMDFKDVESLFYATSVSKKLNACQLDTKNVEILLQSSVSKDNSPVKIYHALSVMKNLKIKVDDAKVADALLGSLKHDETPLSYGYVFYAASLLNSNHIKQFHDLIEDIIAQADEVDDKFLQFEGGLQTTAIVIDSAYAVSNTFKKAPTISELKLIQFTNYFLSRKHVQKLRSAAILLNIVTTLTKNDYHIPIATSLTSQAPISDKQSLLKIKVSDLLGGSLGDLIVTADSTKRKSDNAVVLSKNQCKVSPGDKTVYELNLANSNISKGFYTIFISVSPQKDNKKLIGLKDASVEIKVTTEININNVAIGVMDNDQATPGKMTKISYPKKSEKNLEADMHQRFVLTFSLFEKNNDKQQIKVHQSFVRLSNYKTNEELTFVAEIDANNMYKFELDVKKSAANLNYISGKYSIDLIVGDSVIRNPISWTICDIQLSFGEKPSINGKNVNQYKKKPEIKHLFREPENRPPNIVSTIFMVLCLTPLVVLVLTWMVLGVNIKNIPMGISTFGFHLGLLGIFGLYYCYWLTLTMFETLRYLAILGLPTFLFGNRLLSNLAANRKQEQS